MLASNEIIQYLHTGHIIIHPFDIKNLGTNSYDVTLGEFYYREQEPKSGNVYNMYDEDQVKAVWGDYLEASYPIMTPIPRTIILAPGETILAHTNEFIGGKGFITSMMKARSSLGRNFIEVCKCAGLGDIGYFNRWTMEITNNSRYYTIPLHVGRRIAQIVFFKTGANGGMWPGDYSEEGKYQETPDMKELEQSWTPEMMLPKLYRECTNAV